MKLFYFILFICFLNSAKATNYYFSAISGDDSRTFLQAQNPTTPWKTLKKLNSFFSNLAAGDSILLKRGEVFDGSIIVRKSGTVELPIVISAYGAGRKPVINGLTTLSGWVSTGNGIYQSHDTSLGKTLNILILNGIEYPMGRYPNSNSPNKGWRTITSHTGNTLISDAKLSSSPSFTGAEIVIRKNRFVIDRSPITTHTDTTINYASGTAYQATDGFGYFIQNHISTLDQFGEWYYDSSGKKLNIFLGDNTPSSYVIKASNVATLITADHFNNIIFDNLILQGSNLKAFHLYYPQNILIKNCDIIFSGGDAIYGVNTVNLKIEDCKITNSNNNAMDLLGECSSSQIRNNVISNSGLYAGMGNNNPHSYSGININGDKNIIEYNKVDSTGYIGIRFAGNQITIKNNFINYFCLTKDDGGGIYTGNNGTVARYDQKILGNVVLNGVGAKDGTTSNNSLPASGVYLDDNSSNILVTGNTLANCNKAGMLIHNAHEVNAGSNTLYNNATQLIIQKDAASAALVRNDTIRNNIFFSKKPAQFNLFLLTNANDISLFGLIDSNYYCRPFDDEVVISTSYINNASVKITRNFDLAGWKSQYDKDKASRKSPKQFISYKLNSVAGLNKFQNGTFASSVTGVTCFNCTASWQNSGVPDDGYLQVVSSSKSPSSYITLPVGSVDATKKYILRYTLKGSNDSGVTIETYLRKSTSPYTTLSPRIYRKITDARREIEIIFSPVIAEPDALLIFNVANPGINYQLDNIQLYEANAVIINPDNYIRFEYNPTGVSKIIALDGNYVDAKNKVYVKSTTLEPYSSIILLKQN